MTESPIGRRCLVLRLAGPLQSWGSRSQFNRRETDVMPTKSGIIGLLAAAEGRRRGDDILDLVELRLGVRVDQPGTILRDYHTVSDLRGGALLSASVDRQGRQRKTSPPKHTAVTQRYYLQDAVFVAVIEGDAALVSGLAEAVTRPAFPLALGRRSCVPSQPLLIRNQLRQSLWDEPLVDLLAEVPWQASERARNVVLERVGAVADLPLAAAFDGDEGGEMRADVPLSFEHRSRGFTVRRVTQTWIRVPTGFGPVDNSSAHGSNAKHHDPFTLLGW